MPVVHSFYDKAVKLFDWESRLLAIRSERNDGYCRQQKKKMFHLVWLEGGQESYN